MWLRYGSIPFVLLLELGTKTGHGHWRWTGAKAKGDGESPASYAQAAYPDSSHEACPEIGYLRTPCHSRRYSHSACPRVCLSTKARPQKGPRETAFSGDEKGWEVERE
jgi:hypothetical protein